MLYTVTCKAVVSLTIASDAPLTRQQVQDACAAANSHGDHAIAPGVALTVEIDNYSDAIETYDGETDTRGTVDLGRPPVDAAADVWVVWRHRGDGSEAYKRLGDATPNGLTRAQVLASLDRGEPYVFPGSGTALRRIPTLAVWCGEAIIRTPDSRGRPLTLTELRAAASGDIALIATGAVSGNHPSYGRTTIAADGSHRPWPATWAPSVRQWAVSQEDIARYLAAAVPA